MNAAGVLGTGTASSVSSAVTTHGPATEFILTPHTATAAASQDDQGNRRHRVTTSKSDKMTVSGAAGKPPSILAPTR
jgi:hypothetical protein